MHKTIWSFDLGNSGLKVLRSGWHDHGGYCLMPEQAYLFPRRGADSASGSGMVERFLKRAAVKRNDLVAVALPGDSVLMRFQQFPPIETKELGHVVFFEARQAVPFSLEEVSWDWWLTGRKRVVEQGLLTRSEFGIIATQTKVLSPYLKIFDDLGLRARLAQPASLALVNFLAVEYPEISVVEGEKAGVIAVLSCGHKNSELVICGAGGFWTRNIPIGGQHFTDHLAQVQNKSIRDAESLKCQSDSKPQTEVATALQTPLADFFHEVQRSIGFFESLQEITVRKLILIGGGAKTPGLRYYLNKGLLLSEGVWFLNTLHNLPMLNDEPFGVDPGQFAICYGLALQMAGMGKINTNLVPR